MTLVTNDTPAYRILSVAGFFGPNDHLYGEGSEIYFDGIPNEEMEPLNEPARVRLTAYLENLDTLAKAAADKAGKAFVGRPRNLDGALALATAIQRAEMTVMTAKKDNIPTIEKMEKEDVPEMGKRGRGRPKKVPLSVVAAAM